MAATTTSTIETTRLDIPGNKRLTLSLRPKTESNGSADISIMTEAQRVGSITTKFMGDEAVSILRLCVARYRDEGKLDWDGDWDTLDWNPSAFVTVTLTVPPGQDAKSSGDNQQPGTDSVKQLQESSDTKPTLSGTDGDAMQKATSPAGHDSVLDDSISMPPPAAPANLLTSCVRNGGLDEPNKDVQEDTYFRGYLACVAVNLFRAGQNNAARDLSQFSVDLLGKKIWDDEVTDRLVWQPVENLDNRLLLEGVGFVLKKYSDAAAAAELLEIARRLL